MCTLKSFVITVKTCASSSPHARSHTLDTMDDEPPTWSTLPTDLAERVIESLLAKLDANTTLFYGRWLARALLGAGSMDDAHRLVAQALNLQPMGGYTTPEELVDAARIQWHTLPRLEFFDTTGTHALVYAAKDGLELVADAAIACGADVDRRDDEGRSTLFLAAKFGYLAVVEKLLAAGADTSQSNIAGCSPLRLAARKGFAGVVRALLAAGADINGANNMGLTALDAALCEGHHEAAGVLAAAGGDVGPEMGHEFPPRIMRDTEYLMIRKARKGMEQFCAMARTARAARDGFRSRGAQGPLDAPRLARLLNKPRIVDLANEDA